MCIRSEWLVMNNSKVNLMNWPLMISGSPASFARSCFMPIPKYSIKNFILKMLFCFFKCFLLFLYVYIFHDQSWHHFYDVPKVLKLLCLSTATFGVKEWSAIFKVLRKLFPSDCQTPHTPRQASSPGKTQLRPISHLVWGLFFLNLLHHMMQQEFSS